VYRRGVSSTSESKSKLSADELAMLVSTLQTEVLGIKTRLTESETRNDSLQETIVNLAHENELLKRRLYGNKTERLRTSENQLALGDLLNDEKQLKKQLDDAFAKAKAEADQAAPPPPPGAAKAKPKGVATSAPVTCLRSCSKFSTKISRRPLSASAGMYRVSCCFRRGGFSVLVKRVAKYEVPGKDGPTVLGVPLPKNTVPARLAALVSRGLHPGPEVRAGCAALPARAAHRRPGRPARSRHHEPLRGRGRRSPRRVDSCTPCGRTRSRPPL